MEKIRTNRNDLIKSLSIAGVMAGRSKTMPILDNVRCVADGNGMIITSFNGEVAVTSRCGLLERVNEKIEFCIEPKELLDFLRLIGSEENVELEINDKITMATINHAHGDMSFALEDAKDFPMPEKEETNIKVEIPSDTLTEWIRSSQKFCAHDTLKPIINSMFLYVKDGECGYCATDAQKLITDSFEHDDKECVVESVIPSNAFDAILGIMEKGENVSIKIGKKNIVFRCGDSAVKALTVVGNYPNFKAILPKETKIKVDSVSSSMFIDSVLRTSLVKSSKGSVDKRIKMMLEPNMIKFEALNLMNGKKSTENILCQNDNNLEIGFNCDYLREVISCVNSEIVSLNFTDERHPLIIKEQDNERKTMLLMPQVLKN